MPTNWRLSGHVCASSWADATFRRWPITPDGRMCSPGENRGLVRIESVENARGVSRCDCASVAIGTRVQKGSGDRDHALQGDARPRCDLCRYVDLVDAQAQRVTELLERGQLHVLADRFAIDRHEAFARRLLLEAVQDADLGREIGRAHV